MRKQKFLILILASILFLSACNISDTNIRDKINAPQNKKPPISGKWEITACLGELEEDDPYVGKEGLFHQEAVIIGADYATEPSFKLKNVNTSDYLLYKYKTNANALGIEQDEIQIITILKDNQYFYEFIKIDDNKLIIYIDDKFYVAEKIVEEVNIDEVNRYIDVERSMVRTFDTMDAEKLQTGVLLGIKIPTYDEVNDISQWEYKTIWINSQDKNITDVYELDNLLLPRKNGFWMIHMDRIISQGNITDKINAVPKFTPEDNKEKSFSIMSDSEEIPIYNPSSVLKNILFVGNDYISIEKINMNLNKKKTLEVYALDNMEDEKPIKLSDIIGPDGKEIFEEGAENILSLESAVLNESNMGLDRKNGYWVFKGRVNYKQNEEELYKDFNIKAIPPEEMVSFDEIAIPWNMLKSQIPQAIDVYSSPNEDFIIVVTHSNLLIYPIANGEVKSTEPLRRIPLPNNASIIMSEWAVGRYPDIWQSEVIKNGGEILEE